MKLNKYLEFVSSDLEPVKSFRLKDDLNPKLWTDFEINEEVNTVEDMINCLEEITRLLRSGVTSGYNPTFSIEGEEEPENDEE
mgnify:CR=1 FL=1